MSAPWYKANTARWLAWRDTRITDGRPATDGEGYSEVMALLMADRLSSMGFATLARSLHWSPGKLRRRMAEWEEDEQQVNRYPHWWKTAWSKVSAASSDDGEQQTNSRRTADDSRARLPLRDREVEVDSMSSDAKDAPAPKYPHWSAFLDLYRQHHSSGAIQPTTKATKTRTLGQELERLVKTEENALQVWTWVLTHPDASWWRQKRKGKQLLLSFLVMANYRRMEANWEAPEPPTAASTAMTPQQAWTHIIDLVKAHTYAPEQLHESPPIDAALRQALDHVGGWMTVRDADGWNRGSIERTFVKSFRVAA